jgi:surfeit locus 1 family protein
MPARIASSVSPQVVRRLLLPGFFTLLGVAILAGLGFWQIERMGSKHRLMARVEKELSGAPQALPPESEWPAMKPKGYDYRKVRVQGRFLHDKEFHLLGLLDRPPPAQTLLGTYVLTPLVLDNGSILIVNRGFVPAEKADPATRREGQVEGVQTVTGLLRSPEVRGWFIPDDVPAKNSWFARDPQAMARHAGLARVAPFVLEADATPVPGGLPLGGNTRVAFTDNHLQYALTWFAIALCLIGVFVVFARQQIARGQHEPEPDAAAPSAKAG